MAFLLPPVLHNQFAHLYESRLGIFPLHFIQILVNPLHVFLDIREYFVLLPQFNLRANRINHLVPLISVIYLMLHHNGQRCL